MPEHLNPAPPSLTREQIVAGGLSAQQIVTELRDHLPSLEIYVREDLSNRELLAQDLTEVTENLLDQAEELRRLAANSTVDAARVRMALRVLDVIDKTKEHGGRVEIYDVRIEPCDTYGRTASDRPHDPSAWTPPTELPNWVPDFSDDDDLETSLVSLLDLLPADTVEELTAVEAHVVRWCMLWMQGAVDDIYPAPVLALLESERSNRWTNGPVAQWLIGHAGARQHAIQRKSLRRLPATADEPERVNPQSPLWAKQLEAIRLRASSAGIKIDGPPTPPVSQIGNMLVVEMEEVPPQLRDMIVGDPALLQGLRESPAELTRQRLLEEKRRERPLIPSELFREGHNPEATFSDRDRGPIEHGPLDEIGQGS